MNYKSYSSEGFVIKRTNYKEADRIVTLYTKDFGKITMVAKGVRKLTSRKRGGIEVFSDIKFSAIKSEHSFDILTEVEIVSTSNFKNDLKKVSVGYFLCEVISKLTQEEEKHEEVFNLLKHYFNEIEESKNLKKLRFGFVKDILVLLGFWNSENKMDNPDMVLESITERQINTIRIGKKMLQQG